MSLPLKVIPLKKAQRKTLESLTRQSVGRVAERARMILLSAEGKFTPEIAEIFHCSESKVRRWIKRYQTHEMDGLFDKPRPGRPTEIEKDAIGMRFSNGTHTRHQSAYKVSTKF